MQRKMTNYAPETGRGAGQPVRLGEVLFEFSAVGNSVKVCAVDTDTLVEATIFGPVSAGEAALRHAALQKLRYVLKKKQAETDANNPTKRLYA